MKKIETLIDDIQEVFANGVDITQEEADYFGSQMSKLIKSRLAVRTPRKGGSLRMSQMGKPDRQLWYEYNTPEIAEPMHPNNYVKFLIGDIIEEVVLFVAKKAGHSVGGEQGTLQLAGITGHRDAVIDGVTVDAKSASPYSFVKFKEGLPKDKDPFGYHVQLQSYLEAGKDDSLVTDKTRAAFLAVQKVSGEMVLDIHEKTDESMSELYEYKKVMVAGEQPDRCFEAEPMGQSGNMKLGVNCSYCPFKKECWPGLRTFLYSYGPVFLTEVKKEPNVYEVVEGEIQDVAL